MTTGASTWTYWTMVPGSYTYPRRPGSGIIGVEIQAGVLTAGDGRRVVTDEPLMAVDRPVIDPTDLVLIASLQRLLDEVQTKRTDEREYPPWAFTNRV